MQINIMLSKPAHSPKSRLLSIKAFVQINAANQPCTVHASKVQCDK